jgi:hypothetical protein
MTQNVEHLVPAAALGGAVSDPPSFVAAVPAAGGTFPAGAGAARGRRDLRRRDGRRPPGLQLRAGAGAARRGFSFAPGRAPPAGASTFAARASAARGRPRDPYQAWPCPHCGQWTEADTGASNW